MDEHPDAWVILKLTSKNGDDLVTYKVLAGFYGGYLHGDSWRLSSGIDKIEESNNHWSIHNVSGSIYHCHKEQERLTPLTSNILNGITNSDSADVEVVTIDEIKDRFINV